MKNTRFILRLFLFACTLPLYAQTCVIGGHKTYLDSLAIPNSLLILPPPPTPGTYDFFVDELHYFQSKQERDTPRGVQAVRDAQVGGDSILVLFEKAFGSPINQQDTPELYELLMCMKETAGSLGTMHAKNHYRRYRPFMYFREHTATPSDEPFLVTNGSFPSGHTAIFYSMALVLSEIRPERRSALMERGYEGGRSRIIVGAHWYSDVEAGRKIAEVVVEALHRNKEFMEQLERAKREENRK